MVGSSDESERLRRLREQQLKARDPHKKQRHFQRTVSSRYRSRNTTTIGDMWGDVAHKWRGAIYGIVLGIVVWILLAIFFQEAWTDIVGILALVIFAIAGLAVGSSFDWRDNIRDL